MANHETGYEGLANGIIIQAAKDYRTALKKLYKNPNDRIAMDEIGRLEQFFYSDWYELLTDVDGEYMVDHLRQDFKEQLIEQNRKKREKAAKKAAKDAKAAALTTASAKPQHRLGPANQSVSK